MDLNTFNTNGRGNLPGEPIIAQNYPEGSMGIGTESDFAGAIQQLFLQIRPTKIIETGTYIGTGTTTIIAEAIRMLGLDADFYTIEVNPEYFQRAKQYLRERDYKVACLNGLSVPREKLPTLAQIHKSTVTDIEQGGVGFVDHEPDVRAEWYFCETHFPDVPDSLLRMVMRCFDFRPDFVLLDSGGHIGNIEFNYLLEMLEGVCYIALDDTLHIKHSRSLRQMQTDPRFTIVKTSDEKFGFAIAKFTPR
jgi:hypothetical protein